jgi:sortase A
MNLRFQRLSGGDAAILLGLALLLFGIGGLYIDTATVKMRTPSAQEGRVIRRVYSPPAAVAPLAQAQQAAQALPTLAPLPPESQSPLLAATALPGGNIVPGAEPGTQAGNNTFLAAVTPSAENLPTAENLPPAENPPQALTPQRIVIPAIQLDAPVLPSGYALVDIDGQVYQQWEAPQEYAVGWHQTSAFIGAPGNTVLNGHNNIYGSVFARLIDLNEGDAIEIHSGEWRILYTVTNKMVLPERDEDLSVRLENGRWMQPTSDERLTLVSCWPPESNTHRVFIVASPVEKRMASSGQGP